MVYRVFVELDDYNPQRIASDAPGFRGSDALVNIRTFSRFDVEGLDAADFQRVCSKQIFNSSYQPLLRELPVELDPKFTFAVELKPGTYDARADAAEQAIQLVTAAERPTVRCATVFAVQDEDAFNQLVAHFTGSLDTPVFLSTWIFQPIRRRMSKSCASSTNFRPRSSSTSTARTPSQ